MILSVIIPASGRCDLLMKCLKSLDENVDFEYEVCVVDDGSGLDESKIRAETHVSYPLLWRSFDIPKGRSAARNEGIQSTTGEIIVFLDSDMETRDGFLEAHLNSHKQNPHAAVIGRIIWPKNGSFLKYIGSRGVAKLKRNEPVPPWYFVTGNASIERNDLPSNPAFDESLPGWGGEDLDLGMKLNNHDMAFIFQPEAISFHNFDGDIRNHVNRTFLYGRNALPVLIERYPDVLQITRIDLLNSLFWRFSVRNIIFYPLLSFSIVFDKLPLPAKLFDYLTFAAYARGWLERKIS